VAEPLDLDRIQSLLYRTAYSRAAQEGAAQEYAASLLRECRRLRAEVAALREREAMALEALRRENEALRARVGA
jgi:hypothetical protein